MAEVVRTAPAEFIEAGAKTYLDDLTKAIGTFKTTDLSTIMGPQFVAGPGALTTQAEGLASGLGSFQPFLTEAAAAQTRAKDLVSPTAYQSYMSPYQQDVIDTTLTEFDRQAQRGLPALSARAVAAGAFGGGREGVERAEYQAASDRNRAALQAQLLQQGFGTAQQLAGQAFGQQQALGAGQLGLAQQSPALLGQQISALTGLGAQQAARAQQQLTAQQQLASRQALQPLEAAQQFGSGVTQLIAGYPGRENILPPAATPSPLATGLGTASTLAGIYRLINPTTPTINLGKGFAEGGRIGFAEGPVLPPDTTQPVNPFGPKPGDFGIEDNELPNKKMASYGYDDAMSDSYDMYLDLRNRGVIPMSMSFRDFLQLSQEGGFFE
jgi:hypothetical protein